MKATTLARIASLGVLALSGVQLGIARSQDSPPGPPAGPGRQGPPLPPRMGPEARAEQMARQLGLSDSQKKQIAEILKSTQERIEAVLTEEQKKWMAQMRPGGPGFPGGQGPGMRGMPRGGQGFGPGMPPMPPGAPGFGPGMQGMPRNGQGFGPGMPPGAPGFGPGMQGMPRNGPGFGPGMPPGAPGFGPAMPGMPGMPPMPPGMGPGQTLTCKCPKCGAVHEFHPVDAKKRAGPAVNVKKSKRSGGK